MSSPIEENLLKAQQFRYAAKVFDRNRAVPESTWATLEECLRSTPSSYNLQPWKFIVITDDDLKTQLKEHSFNQAQVEDCSHFVVFCAKEKLDAGWIQRLVKVISATRGVAENMLASYSEIVSSDVLDKRKEMNLEIGIRHCFLALGNLMTSAALLGIDTCPIEGFVPQKYDEILGLQGQGWKSCVTCAVGYRNPKDKYSTLPKVRFPKDEVIVRRG